MGRQWPAQIVEFNADTPTFGLIEASVAQWHWLEDVESKLGSNADQFNSLHEALIEQWKWLKSEQWLRDVHFTCVGDSEEDGGNLDYLRDTAIQQAYRRRGSQWEEIGWSEGDLAFVDMDNQRIETLFKLLGMGCWPMSLATISRKTNMRIIGAGVEDDTGQQGTAADFVGALPEPSAAAGGEFSAPQGCLGDYVNEAAAVAGRCQRRRFKRWRVIRADGRLRRGRLRRSGHADPSFEGNFVTIGSWIVGDSPAGIGLRAKTPLKSR